MTSNHLNQRLEHIPERGYLEQQISRAEQRMNQATSPMWRHLWWGVMARKINARNAKRSHAEVRQIERERGLR